MQKFKVFSGGFTDSEKFLNFIKAQNGYKCLDYVHFLNVFLENSSNVCIVTVPFISDFRFWHLLYSRSIDIFKLDRYSFRYFC